jgi:hypothetical protein
MFSLHALDTSLAGNGDEAIRGGDESGKGDSEAWITGGSNSEPRT